MDTCKKKTIDDKRGMWKGAGGKRDKGDKRKGMQTGEGGRRGQRTRETRDVRRKTGDGKLEAADGR